MCRLCAFFIKQFTNDSYTSGHVHDVCVSSSILQNENDIFRVSSYYAMILSIYKMMHCWHRVQYARCRHLSLNNKFLRCFACVTRQTSSTFTIFSVPINHKIFHFHESMCARCGYENNSDCFAKCFFGLCVCDTSKIEKGKSEGKFTISIGKLYGSRSEIKTKTNYEKPWQASKLIKSILYFQANFFQLLFGSSSNIRTCNCSKIEKITKKIVILI